MTAESVINQLDEHHQPLPDANEPDANEPDANEPDA